jgi:DnaJ-class molecular chaperone
MTEKTLYGVLELDRAASFEAVAAAYSRLKDSLATKAAEGDEAALLRLQAVRESYLTLSNPAFRARYDRSLDQRSAPTTTFSDSAESAGSNLGRRLGLAVLALSLAAGVYYGHLQRVERQQAEQRLREEAEARAKAEAERQKVEDEMASRELARQKRLEELRYQQWADRIRREGEDNMRRNELARRSLEAEERREQERLQRVREMERSREEAAARYRLEQQKRKLRELESQNTWYSR